MKAIIFFLLIGASFGCFADRILLSGRPIVLEPEENYYRFPKNYNPSNNYHFVDFSGDKRVCFLAPQPRLKPLDLLRIHIVQYGKKFLWNCYRYNPNFFKINY